MGSITYGACCAFEQFGTRIIIQVSSTIEARLNFPVDQINAVLSNIRNICNVVKTTDICPDF